MSTSPVASSSKVQTALTNLGIPNGFIAYDTIPLLRQLVIALGNISSTGGGAITGEGRLWFTDTAPTGWLICDGSAVSRATYADLFAVIGETYGAGDGSTTFNIPDFLNNVPLGKGPSGPGVNLGDQVGSQFVSIEGMNLPTLDTTTAGASTGSDFQAVTVVSYSGTAGATGLEVVQPSLVVNFIIKT